MYNRKTVCTTLCVLDGTQLFPWMGPETDVPLCVQQDAESSTTLCMLDGTQLFPWAKAAKLWWGVVDRYERRRTASLVGPVVFA